MSLTLSSFAFLSKSPKVIHSRASCAETLAPVAAHHLITASPSLVLRTLMLDVGR